MASSIVEQANACFVDESWVECVRLYTKAIEASGASDALLPGVYSKRAASYIKLKQWAEAADDAARSVELDASQAIAWMRKGRAEYELDQFAAAGESFQRASQLGTADAAMWVRKCEAEMEGVISAPSAPVRVGEKTSSPVVIAPEVDREEVVPEVVLPLSLADKARTSFYQSVDTATLELLAKKLKPEDVVIEYIGDDAVRIRAAFPDGSVYDKTTVLFGRINPSECKFVLNQYKLCLTLKKLVREQWEKMEVSAPEVESIVKSYPTSSKKKADWGQVERTAVEEEEKETPDGDQALNKLFQNIYGNASEETKRAMIKSFQTSGGTVLSTNWDEVKNKNYEETVEAPAGMQVHKWQE